MARHHATRSPSSLPAKKVCGDFQSGSAGAAAQAGTRQHEGLESLLKAAGTNLDFEDAYFKLDADQQENVRYVYELTLSLMDDYGVNFSDLRIEEEVQIFDRSGFIEQTFGSMDISFTNVLIDAKFGEFRDYKMQMLAYALGIMQKYGYEEVVVIEAYGKKRRYKEYNVTREEAENEIYSLFESLEGEQVRKASAYCDWCVKGQQELCDEPRGVVEQVLETIEEKNDLPQLMPNFDKVVAKSIEIMQEVQAQNGEFSDEQKDELAGAGAALNELRKVRDVVSGWVKNFDDYFKRFLEFGGEIPNYELKSTKGRAAIDDGVAAYKLAGVPMDKFFKDVKISPTTLAKSFSQDDPLSIIELFTKQGKEIPEYFKEGRGGKYSKDNCEKAVKEAFEHITNTPEPTIKVAKKKPVDAKTIKVDKKVIEKLEDAGAAEKAKAPKEA